MDQRQTCVMGKMLILEERTNDKVRWLAMPSSRRKFVPPAVVGAEDRPVGKYVPSKFKPLRMDRWRRNALVWGACAIVIVVVIIVFVNWMLPEDSRRIIEQLQSRKGR